MSGKSTPWKLDRPYDPDVRADALKRKFARYHECNGAGRRAIAGRPRFLPGWLLIAIGAVLAVAVGIA